jgi:hypothetical protein
VLIRDAAFSSICPVVSYSPLSEHTSFAPYVDDDNMFCLLTLRSNDEQSLRYTPFYPTFVPSNPPILTPVSSRVRRRPWPHRGHLKLPLTHGISAGVSAYLTPPHSPRTPSRRRNKLSEKHKCGTIHYPLRSPERSRHHTHLLLPPASTSYACFSSQDLL